MNIEKIEFFSDAIKIGEATAPPYTCTWGPDLPQGNHALTARATYLEGGVVNSAPVTIQVQGAVVIISPENGSIIDASFNAMNGAAPVDGEPRLQIYVETSGVPGTVVRVEFYSGSELQDEEGTADGEDFYYASVPYVMEGEMTFTAVAYDEEDNPYASNPVTVTMIPGLDTDEWMWSKKTDVTETTMPAFSMAKDNDDPALVTKLWIAVWDVEAQDEALSELDDMSAATIGVWLYIEFRDGGHFRQVYRVAGPSIYHGGGEVPYYEVPVYPGSESDDPEWYPYFTNREDYYGKVVSLEIQLPWS